MDRCMAILERRVVPDPETDFPMTQTIKCGQTVGVTTFRMGGQDWAHCAIEGHFENVLAQARRNTSLFGSPPVVEPQDYWRVRPEMARNLR